MKFSTTLTNGNRYKKSILFSSLTDKGAENSLDMRGTKKRRTSVRLNPSVDYSPAVEVPGSDTGSDLSLTSEGSATESPDEELQRLESD